MDSITTINQRGTNEEVYKYFKLSEEDIELINSTNIVGYKNIIEQVII
jgi:hypothetical protein